MRELTNFTARGGQLVRVEDSISGLASTATWSGDAKRLWVRARYGHSGYPQIYDPIEVWELNETEQPEPEQGWAYGLGFFG